MTKFLFVCLTFAFISNSAICQSNAGITTDTAEVSATEFIPVGGHSEKGVPAALQGVWILKTALAGRDHVSGTDKEKNKQVPGNRRNSITHSKVVNGVTFTSTEIEVEQTGIPEKKLTPPQSTKMHRPEKPSISFYGLNETFSGFTGCNKFSGRYEIEGSRITFRDASPSTKMVCLGEANEEAFLKMLRDINAFRVNNGGLELMRGDDVLLVFARK